MQRKRGSFAVTLQHSELLGHPIFLLFAVAWLQNDFAGWFRKSAAECLAEVSTGGFRFSSLKRF